MLIVVVLVFGGGCPLLVVGCLWLCAVGCALFEVSCALFVVGVGV